jgi:hypothetical protein
MAVGDLQRDCLSTSLAVAYACRHYLSNYEIRLRDRRSRDWFSRHGLSLRGGETVDAASAHSPAPGGHRSSEDAA